MQIGSIVSEILTYALVFSAVLAIAYALVRLAREIKDTGVGFWLGPRWMGLWRVRKRRRSFEAKILDLTMGLANAMKAGMALPQALEKVGEQMGGVMKDELSVTLREYRLGMGIVDAMERLRERMPCEDMRLLTSAIRLTSQTGGSLVDVLTQMVDTIRNRVEFQQKLRSLTAQGKFEALAMAAAPVAAFLLLYFVQPSLMMPLLTTVTGWCAIAAALTLEVIGYLIIRKIITIEV